MKPLGMQVW